MNRRLRAHARRPIAGRTRRFPGARGALATTLGALLAACSTGPPPAPAAPAGLMHARTAAPADPAATQVPGGVEVVLDDVPPGRTIEAVTLIDPAGGRYPAARLVEARREVGATEADPAIGIGVTGGSSSGVRPVIGLSLSLFGGGEGAGRSRRRVIARVPLDPAPPQGFAGWRLAVAVTEVTGERRTLDLPLGAAPAP